MRNETLVTMPFHLLKNLKRAEVVILDVRTPHEFVGGHVAGAIHIPYDQLDIFIEEIMAWNKPVVVCSSGGRRSGIAMNFLSKRGIKTIDGGNWEKLDKLFSN